MERLRECKNIVVIAHSQGAALAYLCLSKNLQTRVRLFITVGSGLLKLHQLNSERLRLLVGFCAFLVPVSGLVALLVVAHWYGFYDYSVGKDPLDAVLGALFFVIALAVAAVRQKGDGELEQQAARFQNDGIKWIDMYAGMDPVPNGPLFLRKTSSPESVEVCNGASVLGDHTSYHKNVDELFLLIVRAIAKYSGTKLQLTELTPRDEAVVAFAGPFRQIRIASRRVDEFLLVLALVAVLARPELIAAVGSYVGESINAACRWVGVGACWKEPAAPSGLVLTLLAYALLRMGIAAFAGAWNHFSTNAVYNRLEEIWYWVWAFLTFYSHLMAATVLSLVFLLYYPGQVPYVDALTWMVPEADLLRSPHYRQGPLMGALAAVVLTLVDVVSTLRLVFRFNRWPKE